MDYKEILKIVRAQNPTMSFKDAQKTASEMFNKYKENQLSLQSKLNPTGAPAAPAGSKKPVATAPPVSDKPAVEVPPHIADAERAIRSGPIDVNKIMSIGMQVLPNGHLVKYGKADNKVNTLVAWEDDSGNRVPFEGFFEIFI